MSQQLGPKVRIGTGFPPLNNVGAWAEIMDAVLFDTVWAQVHYMFVDVLPSGLVLGSLNFELGIGPLGAEVRKWKSMGSFQGGSELEFDDSGHTFYLPFSFRKDDRLSGRFAGINQSFGHNIEIQLQIFS